MSILVIKLAHLCIYSFNTSQIYLILARFRILNSDAANLLGSVLRQTGCFYLVIRLTKILETLWGRSPVSSLVSLWQSKRSSLDIMPVDDSISPIYLFMRRKPNVSSQLLLLLNRLLKIVKNFWSSVIYDIFGKCIGNVSQFLTYRLIMLVYHTFSPLIELSQR